MSTMEGFCDAYKNLIGRNPTPGELVAAQHAINSGVNLEDYIASLSDFKQRYGDLIRRVYCLATGAEVIDEDLFSLAMKRFARQGYTPDDFAEEIRLGTFVVPARHPPEMYTGSDVAEDEIQSIDGKMRQFANDWHRTTGGRIDARELIRYFSDGIKFQDMPQVKYHQRDVYIETASIYKKYTGADLSVEDFLDQYIDLYDVPGFCAGVVEDALVGEAYGIAMREHISDSHKRIFSCDYHPDDLEFAFGMVKHAKLSLDDNVDGEVIEVHDQLMLITDKVHETYRSILGRPAEEEEARAVVDDFRLYGEFQAVSDLKDSLYNGLEYQDVIKSRLTTYLSQNGKAPKNKDVYEGLTLLLKTYKDDLSKAIDNLHICSR